MPHIYQPKRLYYGEPAQDKRSHGSQRSSTRTLSRFLCIALVLIVRHGRLWQRTTQQSIPTSKKALGIMSKSISVVPRKYELSKLRGISIPNVQTDYLNPTCCRAFQAHTELTSHSQTHCTLTPTSWCHWSSSSMKGQQQHIFWNKSDFHDCKLTEDMGEDKV